MQIQAIIFDMGGTLRQNIKRDEPAKVEMVRQILRLLDADLDPADFTRLLTERARAYENWAAQTLDELGEVERWTRWLLPDWPADLVASHAMELNRIWREAIRMRIPFPEMRSTILELARRGYRLGLVSNTTSSVDSPQALETAGIADCFETIILSCVIGRRKPAPEPLLEAARQLDLDPALCAYVGDRPDWDVAAARSAGYGKVILIRGPRMQNEAVLPLQLTPDEIVDSLAGVLGVFTQASV